VAATNRDLKAMVEDGRFEQTCTSRNIETIPTPVFDALTNYDWPGNIRELQDVLERSVILTNRSALQVPMHELKAPTVTYQETAPAAPRSSERQSILKALEKARGMVGRTARRRAWG